MQTQENKLPPLVFLAGGREFTKEELTRNAPKTRRPTINHTEGFHKGFRVEGHPPGALETAKQDHSFLMAAFEAAQRAGQSAGKRPAEWSESYWRANTKKRPVRAKPYEVPEAAETCKELAVKAGWLDVVVTEIKRERLTA